MTTTPTAPANNTYTLVSPITTHQGEIRVLKLNRPKARTFTKYGDPFTVERSVDSEGHVTAYKVSVDAKAIAGFIADMAGIDPIDVEDIDGYDFQMLKVKVQDIVSNPPTPAI